MRVRRQHLPATRGAKAKKQADGTSDAQASTTTEPQPSGTDVSPNLRLPFAIGGGVCFAVSALLFIPERRTGNIVAMCGALATVVAAELMRGLMTLTNIRGYRVALPVFAVATLSCFIANAAGIPGSGAACVISCLLSLCNRAVVLPDGVCDVQYRVLSGLTAVLVTGCHCVGQCLQRVSCLRAHTRSHSSAGRVTSRRWWSPWAWRSHWAWLAPPASLSTSSIESRSYPSL